MPVSPTGLSPSTTELSSSFGYQHINRYWQSYNPAPALPQRQVWAILRSLATTCGIIIYFLFLRLLRCFSSPRSPTLVRVDGSKPSGLPHSEICGSQCMCHSAAAFRDLSRPSSPPRAKASAVCSFCFSFIFLLAL